ncbi:unnamed protein product [Cladocopium goreaui]|uniref:DNA (cytosine-5-)-methyltransferase n=1 Tax=Cladocopium goreaui TaxID=2562237 RepID=A0A9P1DUM7_9DINO|nr:unnamed protein product [Cladocopium goreaui]
MVSALGGLKEVSATQKFTPRLSHPPETHRPFSVGRSRAQNMLAVALATQDDQAKVRRLEQALETPCVRYERAQTPRLMQVARDATVLRGELTRKVVLLLALAVQRFLYPPPSPSAEQSSPIQVVILCPEGGHLYHLRHCPQRRRRAKKEKNQKRRPGIDQWVEAQPLIIGLCQTVQGDRLSLTPIAEKEAIEGSPAGPETLGAPVRPTGPGDPGNESIENIETVIAQGGAALEGAEVDVDSHEQWSALQPVPGLVVEFSAKTSSLAHVEDDWAAYFISKVENRLDGSLVLSGHYMGCTDPDLGKQLEETAPRLWSFENFKGCDYVVASKWTAAKRWIKALEEEKGETPGGKKGPGRKPPGAGRAAGRLAGPSRRRAAKEKPGPDTAIPGDLRAKLREKLAAAKKMKDAGTPAADVEESEVVASSEEKSSYTDEEEPLGTGTTLPTLRPPALRRGDGARVEGVEDPSAIRDISTKSWSGQLALKALEVTNQEAKKKKKKKSKHPGKEMAEALAKILTQDGKKKKKKKKKRKRTVLADGTIRSYSASSSASSDSEEKKDESETDLEAPVKKRSRDKPGSVLAMLVNHVRDQMEQAALTDLPQGHQAVTSGVKLATYFAQQVRPAHPTFLRELREMHSLAATMDLLRRGDIARVGDSLAARFMALHQSILDNGWTTARFMELHPMEESAAGSASIVLASRKHGRLVDKVQGKGTPAWGNWGWGARGCGKGGWKGSGEFSNAGKGEKGKGKDRGKKGKHKGNQGTWDEKTSDWAKSKVLSCCTTLKRSGCALAWCLAHGCNITELHDTVFQVRDFFTPGMKHRVARKRAIFPLHEGDFASALRLFASVNLTDSVTEDFTSLWSRTAWTMLSCYACQTLGHGHTPFLKGKWTALETRLVAAVEQTVNRMLSHGHAEVKDTEAVEKELKKRRVSYEGEEIGEIIHQEAERLWTAAGVVSAAKKRKSGEITGQELGAYLNGSERTMGPSPERMINLLLGTMALLSRRTLSRKLLQVIAGRWIHVFQYRRPAMSFLESTWEFISSKGTLLDLQYKVRRELFACMCGLPMMHTFLGAEISDVITASDASSIGGAVGIATQLSSEGEDFVKSSLRADNPQPTGIMVLSLFHGIGGSFRAYDVLGIRPDALVAFDIHQPAMRITSRRWPHAELYGDVRQLNKAQLEQLLMRYPTVTELHVWGGFPCVDLSSVNVRGQGLDGPQSSLFYELKRVLKELKEIGHIKVKFIAENVASMPKHECERITEELQVKPYHLNCADAVPMQRPRLCWTSECLEGCLGGITFSEEQYWVAVSAPASYPQQADWITEGTWWPGGDEGYTLPTALKSIERKRPPPAPAGIHRVFHVTDSYICMSVISKGRTSSRQLSRVLKKETVSITNAVALEILRAASEDQQAQGMHKDRKKAWQDKQEKEKKEEKEEKEEKQEKSEAHENPKPPPSPEDLLKEEEAAALRIQSLYRGQKDRQTVKAMAAQEAQAVPRRNGCWLGESREMAI